jgi:DNA-binding transcriptional LysR family regulator
MCGLGIGFLPRLTVQEEVAQGKLQAIALASTSQPHSLHIQAIYLERKWRSHAFQDLLDLLRQAASPEG